MALPSERPGDAAAIEATLRDYFEGWFDADVARMERALHPELAKRGRDPDGRLHALGAPWMIAATAKGQGKAQKPADPAIEITVHEIHGDIATATVHSAVYVEHAHLVRTPAGWRILNTLFVRRP